MEQREHEQLIPFLGDAAVSFVPELRDEQLVRVARALTERHPHILVSRLSDFTALIQGIRVEADSAHSAKRLAWEAISSEIRAVISTPEDAGTALTSIDVRLPAESLFDLD
jgi:hypothetical protein